MMSIQREMQKKHCKIRKMCWLNNIFNAISIKRKCNGFINTKLYTV